LGRARDRRLWVRYVHRHYPRATVLQALNTEDAARLQEMLQRPVDVRPLVVPLPDASADPGAAPPRALFFGDYAHHPNPEAAQRLAREVWPRVREQVADAELVLAGPRADAGITELAALPGVRWLGYVEDLAGLLGTVRLVLAPLFSGSGSRMKILTALAHGLPVVSNALGLRGVDARSPAVERAESTERLTAAAAALLRDPGAARIAGTAARRWAEQHVSPDALARAQIDKLAGLRA
jgi:glycosyltransferase involved in cell wall biosynthesis